MSPILSMSVNCLKRNLPSILHLGTFQVLFTAQLLFLINKIPYRNEFWRYFMRLGLHRNHGKHFVPQLPIINQSINIFLHTTLGMGEIKIITCHSWLVRVIRLVESAMGNPDPPQLLIGIIRCHVVFY